MDIYIDFKRLAFQFDEKLYFFFFFLSHMLVPLYKIAENASITKYKTVMPGTETPFKY